MDLSAALRAAKGGQALPLYVFVGEERFLVDRCVAALKKAALGDGPEGFNDDLFQGKGLSGKSVTGAARTMPMMADKRFVLVRGVEDMAAAELDALVEYIEAPSEDACLVLMAEKLDGRSRFVKAAKKADVWFDALPLKGPQMRSFAVAEANERGHGFAGAAADALVDAIGADLAAMDDAVERLSLYVGPGNPIDLAAVEACVTRVRTESVWALVDAVSMRDRKTALTATGSLLADREPPLKILALVSRQIRMVAKMRQALADGAAPADAAKAAGAPPFKARDLTEAARRFKHADLRNAFRILNNADLALKGSKRQPGLVLEEAILELCRPT